jgi:hypothetical protein
MTRRQVLRMSVALLFAPALDVSWYLKSSGAATTRPSIGAIRWDAWYDPIDGKVAKAVEETLGPAKYHLRMPFFGTELAPDRVRINGYSQAILDQEIELAAYAGLDYWAFDAYAPDNAMSNALRLYLSSKAKDKMKFCMLADIGVLANRTMLGWHRELMKDASYQQVLDGRPLYYLLMPNAAAIERIGGRGRAKELVDGARTDASSGGGHNPYIVLLQPKPQLGR